MSLRDIALAFLVVAVWGTNFVVIKAGLRDMPPFLFALLRFLFSAVPFVFFLPRPRTPWRWIALYGVLVGAGQFGLLYYAMRADISPGLASLVIQSQAIFTIALSVWIFHERVGRLALAGVAIAVAGLAVIASHLDGSATLAGIVIVLAAGLAWAVANVVGKKASAEREAPFGMLAFIAWASVFAVPPLVLLTVVLEGPAVAWHAMANADAAAWGAVAWQVVGNTLFGWAAWSYLMVRYDAAVVAPYALLIPVFGMGASALLLGEPLPAWKLAGGALVVAGIAAIVLSGTVRLKPARVPAIGD
jgi:O-acetylserine/cysteine efflux transporter